MLGHGMSAISEKEAFWNAEMVMSVTRLLILVALVVAGGVSAFLLLEESGSSAGGVEDSATIATKNQGKKGVPQDPGEPASDTDAVTPVLTTAFREMSAPDPARALTLRVERKDGSVVSGAVIRLHHAGAGGDGDDTLLEGYEKLALRTDSGGSVVLRDVPEAAFRLVARHGAHLGFLEVSTGELALPADRTITLKAIRQAVVSVIDRTGRPVANVFVMPRHSMWMEDELSSWTSDPDGLVRFEINALNAKVHESSEFRPVAFLASGAIKAKGVPWNDDGVTRATIEVDRGVAVRVTVTRPDGTPVSGSRTLRWWPADKSEAPHPSGLTIIGGIPEDPGRKRVFDGAITVMGGFKPGTAIKLKLEEKGRCPVRKTVMLPSEPSVCEVALVQGEGAPRIEIPVVDERGVAWSNRLFTVTVEYTAKEKKSSFQGSIILMGATSQKPKDRLSTDAKGLLSRFVEPDRAGRITVRQAKVARHGSFMLDRQKPLMEKAFPALSPGMIHKFPPLEIPSKVVAVAGRVLGKDGEGVVGALVTMIPGPKEGSERHFRSGKKKLTSTTDEEGRFQILSDRLPPAGVVHAQLGKRALSEVQSFVPGDTSLVLHLLQTGSLAGVVTSGIKRVAGDLGAEIMNVILTDAGLPWTRTRSRLPMIELEPVSGPARGSEARKHPGVKLSDEADKKGDFLIPGLLPGTYNAKVKLSGYEVLEVPGIVIHEGEVTRDPRLDGITLGQSLREARVTVRTPDGNLKGGAEVKMKLHGQTLGKARTNGTTDSKGRAALLVPRVARVDVSVEAKGFRTWEGENAAFPLEVTLDPGCTLAVFVQGAEALEGDDKDRKYEVELHRKKKDDSRRRSKTQDLDLASGRATFTGVGPGTYELTLGSGQMITMTGNGFSLATYSKNPGRVTIGSVTIEAGDVEKALRPELDAGQIEKLKK